jgi:hypothetical protein
MTTYFDINSMPEEMREAQSIRLEKIWSEGVRAIMHSLNFIESLHNGEGGFNFDRCVGWGDDNFFQSLRIALPTSVANRVEQTLSDLAVITTALANSNPDFSYTQTQEGNK